MKLLMKSFLAMFLLCSIGAYGQDGSNCHFSQPVGVQTRCPCTGSLLIVTECSGTPAARVARTLHSPISADPLVALG